MYWQGSKPLLRWAHYKLVNLPLCRPTLVHYLPCSLASWLLAVEELCRAAHEADRAHSWAWPHKAEAAAFQQTYLQTSEAAVTSDRDADQTPQQLQSLQQTQNLHCHSGGANWGNRSRTRWWRAQHAANAHAEALGVQHQLGQALDSAEPAAEAAAQEGVVVHAEGEAGTGAGSNSIAGTQGAQRQALNAYLGAVSGADGGLLGSDGGSVDGNGGVLGALGWTTDEDDRGEEEGVEEGQQDADAAASSH